MPEEEKVVTIKFYYEQPPQMTIKYTDKKDLFEQFQKNLKRLDFPTDEVYWYDWENVHTRMRTPEDVYIAVKDNPYAKMFARDPRNRATFSSLSSDEDEEELEKGRRMVKQSKDDNPRSEHRHGSRHHADYSYYCMPWNYAAWMDNRYGYMPFPCDARAYDMDSHGRRDAKPHCHCKGRHGEVDEL
ncbi:hypothetical protein Y032_0112g286 [Ancylostoma ceylanicum]|uniref:Uncharacterized protein n=1 Tax=Ancylostoma ceylanicum TaxID=53326 RepID=A0A016TDP6_9BILA|nr:hypothetical protein Y032_0112g286 [Ancylostoma ceylanicum]